MLPSQGTPSQVSAMTCRDSELQKISKELDQLSFKRQQLLEKKKIQSIFQELRNRVEFKQTEEAALQQQEQQQEQQQQIDTIDNQLNKLTARKAELQNRLDNIDNAKEKNNKKEVGFTTSQKIVPEVPAAVSNIFYVEPPPPYPAPTVILDLEKLPPYPSKTQCPECRQFITTETFSTVSSVTWMVCFMTALIGCLAGCCFIPFCFDRFKTTTHRCPKCRTSLQIIKRL